MSFYSHLKSPRKGTGFGGAVACVAVAMSVASGCARKPEAVRTVTVAFSNDMLGEIRSCGCAANDLGGLGRRATYLDQLREHSADFLLLDGGGFFSSKLNYGREKADLTVQSMSYMKYDGVVLGEEELGFGADYIVSRCRESRLPVVVANLRAVGPDTLLFQPFREIRLQSGLRVGIVGVMSERLKLPPQVAPGSLRVTSALDAASRYVAELRPRNDLVVVLAHVDRGEALRLVRRIPDIDLVVMGGNARSMRNTEAQGRSYLLQVSDRGRYQGVARFHMGKQGRIESLAADVAPLDARYEDDDAIAKLFASYDLMISAKEQSGMPAGVFAARKGLKTPFVGATACLTCHGAVHAQWNETRHAHAFEVLAGQSREFDRDCIPCHTTGFYERGGFENFTVTPALAGVQCESCHGNGHEHAANPKLSTSGDARGVCRSCHTLDQTPDFDFEVFWPRIQH